MLQQGSMLSPQTQGVIGTEECLGVYLGAEKKLITASVGMSPDHSQQSTVPMQHYQNSRSIFTMLGKPILKFKICKEK